MRHYRVDKMAEITVTRLPREGTEEYPAFDIAAYGQKHFGMYSGEEMTVTLRAKSSMAGVVLDRFGLDVILVPGWPRLLYGQHPSGSESSVFRVALCIGAGRHFDGPRPGS